MTDKGSELVCWKCGARIVDIPLPIGRDSECLSCRSELHVCKMCEFFDSSVADQCREPIAEFVKEKERANFCDYFKAKDNAYEGKSNTKADQARAQLEALFGESSQDATNNEQAQTAEDIARAKLDELFKK